jgi:hypothetical protein
MQIHIGPVQELTPTAFPLQITSSSPPKKQKQEDQDDLQQRAAEVLRRQQKMAGPKTSTITRS